MRAFTLFMALSLFSSMSIAAELALRVGFPVYTPGTGGDVNLGAVQTDIDLAFPASATGNMNYVYFRWSAGGCINGMKIKFFRRTGNLLTMTAERGPYSPFADNFNVILSPPVAVQQGDLIGITRLTNCGGPETVNALAGFPTLVGFPTYVAFPSDLSGPVDLGAGTTISGRPLLLGGVGTVTEALRVVIPVVGSTAGIFGSNFKTALQIHVSSPLGFVGRFVFHPQGVSGSASDPSQTFSIESGKTIDFADIVTALGQTGLGSIDVITPADRPPPVLATRVINDAGASGTAGFIEDAVRMRAENPSPRVLEAGVQAAFLITPADLTRSRLNIGVRTLYRGATITVTLKDSQGVTLRSISKTYLPTFFQQVDGARFTGGPIAPNQSIEIMVSSGSIIIYGATTDNTTNDPAVQFAEP